MSDKVEVPLARLLHDMVVIRHFEERTVALRLAGKIYGVVHSYVGQEAVAVGVCSALRSDDKVITYHRGHGHSIAKGTPLRGMMAELMGRATGCCKGKGGSMHIADMTKGMLGVNGIVGAGIPHALGAALASQMLGHGVVIACFFGDGATGQGVFYESLNIAALLKLPVVLVCDNNLYSGPSVPLAEVLAQPKISELGKPFGIPGVTIDGTDAAAVYMAACEAVARARSGYGPTLLDCKSYRWGAHAQRGAVQKNARPPEELEAAMRSDPIVRLRSHLITGNTISERDYAEMVRSAEAAVSDAVAFAESSPFPAPEDALADLFAAERS